MIYNLLHPINWTDWLAIYCCIGLIGLILLALKALCDTPSSFAKTITATLGYKKTFIEVLQDWFVYAVAAICVVIGWPGFLVWLVLEKKREARNDAWYALPDFTAAPEFLVKQMEITEVESENFIYDPIGETPSVPFGHLNRAWEIFKSKKSEGSELQFFQISKGSRIGKYKTEAESEIKGYAWILNGKVVAEFVAEEG